MPQTSYLYAIGRVKVLETRMLDNSRMKKLAAAGGLEDFFKLLQEAGYGEGAASGDDLEALFQKELRAVRQLIWAITPEPEVTGLFFLPVDAHNLKVFFKARLLGQSPPEELIETGGVFAPEALLRAVNEKNYVFLPPPLKNSLDELEKALTRGGSPQLVSVQVDAAIFKYIHSVVSGSANEYAAAYFSLLADFANTRAFIRARILEWDAPSLPPLLVAGGSIAGDAFLHAFALPDEQLAPALSRGKNGHLVAQAVEEYCHKNSVAALERKLDAFVMRFAAARRSAVDSIGPLAGYLVGKEAETRALRIILQALRHGGQPELPELYL
jgi:V/A-type H+-transporting ATPase subunit C